MKSLPSFDDLSRDPVRSIRSVAEARTDETLASLYHYALQCCVRHEISACWKDVILLRDHARPEEFAFLLERFCKRWVLKEAGDLGRMRKIGELLDHGGFYVVPPRPLPAEGSTAAGLRNWAGLIKALHALILYETSAYAKDEFSPIVATAGKLFDQVEAVESAMTPIERRALVRYAIHFDNLDKARALAASGGVETAFEAQLLDEQARLAHLVGLTAAAVENRRPDPVRSVIGSVVWGSKFVEKFMNYHVASLLAQGNIPALASRGRVIHLIVTTEAGRTQIVEHAAFGKLAEHAEVHFICFQERFAAERVQAGWSTYRFYGMLDHLNVKLARELRANLHLLPIDTIFSERALESLDETVSGGADCCCVGYIEVEEEAFFAQLPATGRIEVAGGELLDLASRYPSPGFRSIIMTPENASFSLHPRELAWPVDGGLAIHSIFMHPVTLSARVLARPFHPNHENVDYALIPRVLQADGVLRVMTDTSKIAAVHFRPDEHEGEYLDTGFSLRRFIDVHRYDYAINRECFGVPIFLPCTGLPYRPSSTYAAELKIISAALERPRFDQRAEEPERQAQTSPR